jgi:hypothetical protein
VTGEMADDADDSGVSEQHAKEFFEAYGRAMLEWQYVEVNLFLIFSVLMRGRDHHIVSAAYHAIMPLHSKLGMITEAMRVAFPETPLFRDWRALRKGIKEQSEKRNKLAHYCLLGHIPEEAEGLVTLRLAPSVFDARHKSPAEYDIEQIAAWGNSFRVLTDELDAFSKQLVAQLSG